jgi:hypothetical protein
MPKALSKIIPVRRSTLDKNSETFIRINAKPHFWRGLRFDHKVLILVRSDYTSAILIKRHVIK